MKLVLSGAAIVLLTAIVWLAWPIYGFVSNQFEVARLPVGWQALPADMPQDSLVADEKYRPAASQGMEVLEAWRAKINAPSMSAAIAIDGELVWAGAVGWADIANETPVTTRTAYRIGSTSKPVGITALARLVSAGQIDLDTPISTYANDLPNEAWNQFTPRQLASHTAGLVEYEDNTDWRGLYQSMALNRRFDDPQDALAVFDSADLLFEPGTDFHYSGFDNVLLSAVMQDVADQPFDDLMSRLVFSPLGLDATQPEYLRTAATDFATSYQTRGDQVKPWRRVDLSHKLAAGGYISTPSDLARLGAAWLDDGFIAADVREQFWTPARLSSGEVNEQNYALGFRRAVATIDGLGEVTHVNHGGVSKGAQCWLMIVPERQISIAVSTNRRTDEFFDFAGVYAELLEAFAPLANAAPQPSD